MNWSQTTKVKSDQLNADDLKNSPLTIKIINVKLDLKSQLDQSGILYYEGDNGKPYKPCKIMRRVIEEKWGDDEKAFIGRSITLFRDPKVKVKGVEVGGIRISHMSHMEDDRGISIRTSQTRRDRIKIEHLKAPDSNCDVKAKIKTLNFDQMSQIQELLDDLKWDIIDFCQTMKVSSLSDIAEIKFEKLIQKLKDKKEKKIK